MSSRWKIKRLFVCTIWSVNITMYWSAEPSPLCTCMHAWPMRMYRVAHSVWSNYVTLSYPAPEQGSGTVLFRVSAWHLAMSLHYRKLKPCVIVVYLRATACLHCHCIDNWPKHSGNQLCSQGWCNSCTLLHHWAGLNMTTLPLCYVYLECVYGRTDGRTDRRTKIAKQLQ